ncbi:hypothetical protein DKG71_24710 [Streptomyces sp. NEAU-S7GS2]|nr:hypothetical protein [Streptomyces sp. NEAU-S7GS2]AWN28905.1 hypothetical protein DKG71_24710 [Streptomyces sp. NEAU-S7GS2]
MRGWTPGGAPAAPVEITSASVQRGDVIQIGGHPCRITDLLHLPGGAKRLFFEMGELLTMHARSRLVALRTLRRR